MKFLLSNDDGVDAPGLATLARCARQFGAATIVAPMEPQSGCSHRITDESLMPWVPREEDRIALAGTPADCIRVGLSDYLDEPDWVLTGVNDGGNLGVDVYYSGTVAAAREAVLHGCAAIAFSHVARPAAPIDWEWAGRQVSRLLDMLLARRPEPGMLWNVNLPHPVETTPHGPDPEIVECPVDNTPMALTFARDDHTYRYDGPYWERPRREGGDVELCFSGYITVSPVRLT